MLLTIKTKLKTTKEQDNSLLKTIKSFNSACNYISNIAFTNKIFNAFQLHKLCYYDTRNKFKLSAQLTVRAISKVCESYKVNKKILHTFKEQGAIVYDQRILSIKNNQASILSVDGRIKIPLVYNPAIQLTNLKGQADLIYQKGKFYLCLVIQVSEEKPIKPKDCLGVDLGIVNLATTSDGEFFSGKDIDDVRIKTTELKKKLQSKGSKSAKRHLKRLSGKERRFKKNTNHTIAKRVVSIAKDTQRAIGLEELKGFRVTVNKEQKERFGKWAFDELKQFIEYKAKLSGIPVIFVNPKNTSRTCSHCSHISKANRKSQSEFVCIKCGFTINADINGAINISQRAKGLMSASLSQSSVQIL